MFHLISTVNVVGTRDLSRVFEWSRIRASPVNNGSWWMSRVGTKKNGKKRKKKGKGGGEGKSDVGRINLNAVLLARCDGDVAVIE